MKSRLILGAFLVCGLLSSALPAFADDTSSTQLDSLCSSQYDYSCQFGQTDKQGKQCGYGMPVASTEVKGMCVTGDKAEETSYMNEDGKWVSGSQPQQTDSSAGSSNPQVTATTPLTTTPQTGTAAPQTETSQTPTQSAAQNTLTPGSSVLDNALKWFTGGQDLAPEGVSNILPGDTSDENTVFNPEPILPTGQAQSLTGDAGNDQGASSYTPSADYQPAAPAAFAQPMGDLQGITQSQVQSADASVSPLGDQTTQATLFTAYGVCDTPVGCNSMEGAPTTYSMHPDAYGNLTDQIYTLDAYGRGEVPYVTVAGSLDQQGTTGVIPQISYVDPTTGQLQTLNNVPTYVADTGSAFQNGDAHYDIPITIPPSSYPSVTGSDAAVNSILDTQPFSSQYYLTQQTPDLAASYAQTAWNQPAIQDVPASQPFTALSLSSESWASLPPSDSSADFGTAPPAAQTEAGADIDTKTPAELQQIQDQQLQDRIAEAPVGAPRPSIIEQLSQLFGFNSPSSDEGSSEGESTASAEPSPSEADIEAQIPTPETANVSPDDIAKEVNDQIASQIPTPESADVSPDAIAGEINNQITSQIPTPEAVNVTPEEIAQQANEQIESQIPVPETANVTPEEIAQEAAQPSPSEVNLAYANSYGPDEASAFNNAPAGQSASWSQLALEDSGGNPFDSSAASQQATNAAAAQNGIVTYTPETENSPGEEGSVGAAALISPGMTDKENEEVGGVIDKLGANRDFLDSYCPTCSYKSGQVVYPDNATLNASALQQYQNQADAVASKYYPSLNSDIVESLGVPASTPLPGSAPLGQGGIGTDAISTVSDSSGDEGLAFSPPGYQYENWALPSENEANAYGSGTAVNDQSTASQGSDSSSAQGTDLNEAVGGNPYDCSGTCAQVEAQQAEANQKAAQTTLVTSAAVASKGLNALANASVFSVDKQAISAGMSAATTMLSAAKTLGDTSLTSQLQNYNSLENTVRTQYNEGNYSQVFTLRSNLISTGQNIIATINQRYGR